jgi:hypothetical protein
MKRPARGAQLVEERLILKCNLSAISEDANQKLF